MSVIWYQNIISNTHYQWRNGQRP